MSRHKRFSIDTAFFVTWLLTFIVLYAISYAWHGMLLDDLRRISYPKGLFLMLAAVVYFVIGLALTFLVKYLSFISSYSLRGLVIGGLMGAFIYMIAFVFGISFYANPEAKHILFDLSWQIVEQATGGVFAGWVYSGLLSFSKATNHQ